MESLLQILQQTLLGNLMPKKTILLQKGAIGISVVASITALSFIALFFLALALYSWLNFHMTLPLAALVTAGAILLLCLVIAGGAYLALKSKPEPQQPADETQAMISALTAIASEELGQSVNGNPKTTLLIAGLAGLVAGRYLK